MVVVPPEEMDEDVAVGWSLTRTMEVGIVALKRLILVWKRGRYTCPPVKTTEFPSPCGYIVALYFSETSNELAAERYERRLLNRR